MVSIICIVFILFVILSISGQISRRNRLKRQSRQSQIIDKIEPKDYIDEDMIEILEYEQDIISAEISVINRKIQKVLDTEDEINIEIEKNDKSYIDDGSIQSDLKASKLCELIDKRDKIVEEYCKLNKKKINLMKKMDKITETLTKR